MINFLPMRENDKFYQAVPAGLKIRAPCNQRHIFGDVAIRNVCPRGSRTAEIDRIADFTPGRQSQKQDSSPDITVANRVKACPAEGRQVI